MSSDSGGDTLPSSMKTNQFEKGALSVHRDETPLFRQNNFSSHSKMPMSAKMFRIESGSEKTLPIGCMRLD
jgi:hypothetical protein